MSLPVEAVPTRTALDEIDVTLLRLLSVNARMSQRQLAKEVGMSPPAVGDRIARMERAGIIRGYQADIDRSRIGFPLVVFVLIALESSPRPEILTRLRAMVEVEDVHLVTGPRDLFVRIRVRDHDHLRTVLLDGIWKIPGIGRVESCVSLGGMPPKAYDVELLDAMLRESSRRSPGPPPSAE